MSSNKNDMTSKSSMSTSDTSKRTVCQTNLKCGKLLEDNPYLGVLAVVNSDLPPTSTKKEVKPNEALAKIWMNPSSELLKGAVPDPNESNEDNLLLLRASKKKKHVDVDLSEKVITTELRRSRSYSSNTTTLLSFGDFHYDGYAEGEFPKDISYPFEDIYDEIQSEYSEEDLPVGKSHETQVERIQRLLGVEMRQYKETVKQLYMEELEKMANIIQENAVIDLDARIAEMSIGINNGIKAKISIELKNIMRFIKKYKKDVMIEYFEKINAKYKNRRNDAIINLVGKIDHEIGFSCALVTDIAKKNYQFKLKEHKAKCHEEHKRSLEVEKVKWDGIVQKKKLELIRAKEEAIAELVEEYDQKLLEFMDEENNLIQNEILQLEEELDKKMETAITERVESQRKRADSVISLAVKNTWENETWKCIVKKLIREIQSFINTFIDPSGRTNFVSVYNEMKSKPAPKQEMAAAFSIQSTILSDTSDLEEMIHCGPQSRVRSMAERKAHRELITVAASLINKLVDTVANISKARQAEAKARRLARQVERARKRTQKLETASNKILSAAEADHMDGEGSAQLEVASRSVPKSASSIIEGVVKALQESTLSKDEVWSQQKV